MADVLNPQIVDVLTVENAKVVAGMPSVQLAMVQGAMNNAFTSNMDMLQKMSLFHFNRQLDQAATVTAEEAVATQITAGAGLADKIESLNSVVANNSQQLGQVLAALQAMLSSNPPMAAIAAKESGNAPPVTVKGI